ncbi:MAG: FimV/HubP family polar landmark protein [Gammaproteobacteria bacterium]|nr:FimV/HubP family polar landmark protein [Gammaproteobacteria bacterium]
MGAPLGSWALGLGEIELNSALNQPLNAEIELTATAEELNSLSVSLAPLSAFTSRGIERPGFLSSLQFSVTQNAAGDNIVVVTSTQPISEPFVTMLIEARHARGVSMREYTVLLDPPLFLPQPSAAPVTPPVNQPAASNNVPGSQIERPVTIEPRPAPQPAQQPAPQPGAQAAPPPAAANGANYTVQAGDTLWAVANQYRPAGVSMNQAMISIYQANPAAFDGNINRLRRGAILRIPPSADFGSVTAATANAEVRRQTDEWQGQVNATPQLTLLPPSDEPSAGLGAGNAAANSAAVSALENQVSTLESELENARRLLELRDAELADLQRQLDDVSAAPAPEPEPAAVAADPGVELESEQLFVDDAPVADDVADDAAADATDAAADTAVADAEPEPEAAAPSGPPPASTATTTQAEPSLVDRALEFVMQPIALIGGGVLVLLLGLLAFLRRRRDDVEDVTGQWEALEAEIEEEGADHAATARLRARAAEPDMVVVEGHGEDATAEEPQLSATGQFGDASEFDEGTAEIDALTDDMLEDETVDEPAPAMPEQTMTSETLSSQTVINLDQADPIAEADFHMAYGLYDQAADLIGKALKSDPDNREFKLKLLEVYFVWGNKEQFLELAQSLKGELGAGGEWDKVVIMGKQICPDEPLFSEATAAAGEVDLDLEASGTAAGLDFAFDDNEDDDVDLDLGIGDAGVDADEMTLEASGRHESAASDDEDMLDIGERTQAGLEAALLDTDDDDDADATAEIGDLDATIESPTVEAAAQPGDFDLELDDDTQESPTVEAFGPDSPTVESPTIEMKHDAEEEEGDTVEHVRPAASSQPADMTAELELDDLGLDVADIEGLPDDLGDLPEDDAETGDDDAGEITLTGLEDDADDDLLSATGVTQVLDQDDLEHTGTAILGDDDATMMAPGFGSGADDEDTDVTGVQTEVLEQPVGNFETEGPETEDDLDLNLDDFSSALDGGADTVEQPVASQFAGVDLDVGDDVPADDEPTGTEEVSPLDPQTMTEVGTKLDLARAYIDMGDPEGAKSILEEVLSEGDSGQRSEAQALIDALPA